MRVLYFHQHFVTPKGAGGVRSYAMARKLIKQGHQVTMVCGTVGGGNTGLDGPFKAGMRRGNVDGINVIELNLPYSNTLGILKRAWIFLKFAARSVALALREPSDVVFATTTPLTAGIPGIAARWLRRKPFVFEVRDLWPELPREMGVITNPVVLAMLSALEWASYRSAQRCVALAPGIAEGIARRGVSLDKISVIPNGCDLDIFQAPDVSPWRPQPVPQHDLMAVFTGTHGLANGLDALLDAASELKRRGRRDIWFVLIGNGAQKDALVHRAKSEGLEHVLFLSPVDKKSLAGLMAAADLGVQCLDNVPAFYYGTSPNKFFDYIAAGLPVLNNYPGWLADLIKEHDCGIAVPADDPAAFADAMEWAADHRQELQTQGQRGLELARSEFAREILADRWMKWVTGVNA
mgnify:CR=1 FL=1|jgi:glycosyltransferase involved in cell wall biosynthesis